MGDIDVPIIVMKLRKLCKTEIISVDAVKPPEKKPEPEKPAPPKPSEKIASPVPMNLAERVQSCLCLFFWFLPSTKYLCDYVIFLELFH